MACGRLDILFNNAEASTVVANSARTGAGLLTSVGPIRDFPGLGSFSAGMRNVRSFVMFRDFGFEGGQLMSGVCQEQVLDGSFVPGDFSGIFGLQAVALFFWLALGNPPLISNAGTARLVMMQSHAALRIEILRCSRNLAKNHANMLFQDLLLGSIQYDSWGNAYLSVSSITETRNESY